MEAENSETNEIEEDIDGNNKIVFQELNDDEYA